MENLEQLFNTGNPFMTQRGMEFMDLAKQKKEADLQSLLGAEQRAQAMQPLEMENKRATTRLNASTAALNENSLQDRMKKSFYELAEKDREKVNEDMNRRFQIASAIKANGGQVPLALQAHIPQEELQYYTGPNLDKTLSIGKIFIENSPKWLDQRMKEDAATKRAREVALIAAQSRLDVKNAGTGSTGTDSNSVRNQLLKLKKASEKIAHLKTVLPAMSPEEQEQWKPIYMALRKQAEAEANARMAGQIDLAGATKGKVPVNPAVDLGDASGAAASRPERQSATERITIYKDGKPVGTIPASQKEQAIQQGYSLK